MRPPLHGLVLIAVLSIGACSSESGDAAPIEELDLPEGFSATVVIPRLGRARHLVVRDNGDIYVALRRPTRRGSIAALRDTDGDGAADMVRYFYNKGGTGIRIYDNHLYFATPTEVVRWPLPEEGLVPEGDPVVIAGDFPVQREHADKPICFDGDGQMYVNVGAPSNACQKQKRTKGSPGVDPCPQLKRHAGIWRFDATQPGQSQMDDGVHYATGIRQCIAMAWHPEDNCLYAVQHGRDQLHAFFPEHFTVKENAELPAEEFQRVEKGDDFGWPYSYYDHRQGKRVLAPEYGGDGQIVGRAADFKAPEFGFPGHWAPNDLMFYTGEQFPEKYRGGAFVVFHGSWNRAPMPQRGFKVVFVPFKDGRPTGDYEIFADGFTGREVVERPGQARHRPMGVAQGPDGALYISDSVQGTVWRVRYEGE